jgi:hypothetical protein
VINYVQYHLGTAKPIKNRLKNHLSFWATLNTPDWILDIIENGVKIPFTVPPPSILKPNNRSAVCNEHKQWVRNTLREYLDFGFIKRVSDTPYCVMPLQVKVSTAKNSLIYDMTALNAYVNTNKFSLEGWPEFFVWTTLPFGYTRAPYIVRHLIKPLISKWRSLGASCVVFYDDGMCVDDSATNLQKMSLQIQCDLLRAGLLLGVEKCSWLPVQQLDWNGLRFDFVKSGIEILPDRVQKLKNQAVELIAAWPRVTYRDVARFVGRVVSMAPVFQGLVTIRTKMCQTFVNIRNYRN